MTGTLFRSRNFKLHWISVAASQVGGFFTSVALPWLVLSLSHNNPIVMTTVLAAVSLPLGFFIIFGGGLADRFSPYKTLLVSRLAFVAVMGSLAVLTYHLVMPLWLIYIYALVLGTLVAVGIPCSQSLLPFLLAQSELGKANGIIMGTWQVAQMVGPMAAGWLIWWGRHLGGVPDGQADPTSIAFAFAVDAGAVLLAAVLMGFMRVSIQPTRGANVVELIGQGIRYCWREKGVRMVLGYLMLVSFFLQGPLFAVLPLFTKLNLGLYEREYGTLYATIGLGTIVGVGIAMVSQPSARKLGMVVLGCDFVVGGGFYLLGHTYNPWAAGSVLLVMGGCLGVTMVAGTTWFQTRAPAEYMGRVMSLVMFSVQGLIPFSAALSGYLIDLTSVAQVMGGAGLVIMLVSGIGLMIPRIRRMGDLPEAAPTVPGVLASA